MATDLDAIRAEIVANPAEALAIEPELLKIVPKGRESGLIPLITNAGQRALEKVLQAQRAAGKPMRVIILKARQIGMSTWIQGRLILAVSQLPHVNALTVAHDDEALRKLYRIGERMYRNLPPEIRPEVRAFKRNDYIHFAQKGDLWAMEKLWPDSMYELSTAGSPESGRSGTYHAVHLSEFAFYPQAEEKLVAVTQAVADDPETLIAIESTANGHNQFKNEWDRAMDGVSEYEPFFWPWWKHEEYTRDFPNESERKNFRIGDLDQSPYAEEEPDLVDPGPIDVLTKEHVPLTLEQLHWRRWWIANKCGGKVEKFHQEMPATPTQAFLSTGSKVFEPMLVERAMARAEGTDPRFGEGGPMTGAIVATDRKLQAGRHGRVEVPTEPVFKPARLLAMDEQPDWRVWLDYEDGKLVIPKDDQFVIGVDVSEGLPESGEGDPAYQAIEVINHRTKEQVAEYRSRVDPDLLAEHALLTAIVFNHAWLAIEKTGPGLAVVNRIWHDFHYTFTYWRRRHEHRAEKETDLLGWSTDRATKPLLIAGGQELLREETHGIKSRRLVSEMQTYVRLETGKTVPEKDKYADLLMAWLIAQQVAIEKPVRKPKGERKRPAAPQLRYPAYQR